MRLPSMAARACLVLALVGFGVASDSRASQGEDVLTNQDVVKMVGAKLGDEVIIAKIREAPRADFQLSVDDLVGLRNSGVSEQVIHAMLENNGAGTCQQTYSISGSAGTAGAVVAAGGHSAPTGGNGAYEIAGLPAGTYTLRPSKAGCTFSPATLSVKVPPNAAAKNFRPSCSMNSNAQVIWTVSSLCTVLYIGSGDNIYFFDSNGAVYPNGPGHPGLVFVFPVTFQFQAPRGSTLFLGANDNIGHSWCFGIDGSVPSHDPNCVATVPETGDLVRSIELTCE